MITQDRLKEVIRYDPESGVFTWKNKTCKRVVVGGEAGGRTSHGYRVIRIDGDLTYGHRLAFLYMTGEIPEYVDHINGIRDDNRWDNLRSATSAQNSWNMNHTGKGKSGIKGVHWSELHKKWRVRLKVNGKGMSFGLWDDLEAAELVAILAREKYHGEFANHG